MSRRLLAALALALTSLTVSAENIDLHASSAASIAPQPYTLNLSCADCAFSYSDCRENTHPSSFLTITFSTHHEALLANNEPIFPTPIHMEFHAQRHWGSTSENVPVAYALDVHPLPHQPDATLGARYRLQLTLVDLQGRPATNSPVSIGVVRDSERNLQIIQVEPSAHHRHHYEPAKDPASSAWQRLKSWKGHYNTYLHKSFGSHPCAHRSFEVKGHGDTADVHTVSHCRSRQRLSDWAGDRHYMKHLRPVLLPAVLGLLSGVLACIFGFLVGKLIVGLYYWCLGKMSRAGVERDAERDAERGDERSDTSAAGGVVSEKEALMELYGSPAD
ncbi:hypothetical protein BDW62DRAFT_204535 [Aspergillus aurantiobrunneus]